MMKIVKRVFRLFFFILPIAIATDIYKYIRKYWRQLKLYDELNDFEVDIDVVIKKASRKYINE